jgi:hypothetical protein
MSMGNDLILLEQVRVASPCSAAWEEMHGDDRVRFCAECQLNVYNLSAMSVPEAAAQVREKEGRVCVRFYARKDGTILVENCPVGFRAVRRVLLAQLGTIAGAFMVLFGSVPLLTKERRQAIRYSRVGQMEPLRTLFDWLDPQPLVVMGGPPILVPLASPTVGTKGISAATIPGRAHHRRSRARKRHPQRHGRKR